jgi:hypothetical protein
MEVKSGDAVEEVGSTDRVYTVTAEDQFGNQFLQTAQFNFENLLDNVAGNDRNEGTIQVNIDADQNDAGWTTNQTNFDFSTDEDGIIDVRLVAGADADTATPVVWYDSNDEDNDDVLGEIAVANYDSADAQATAEGVTFEAPVLDSMTIEANETGSIAEGGEKVFTLSFVDQFGNEFITTLRPEGYNANLKWEETTTYNVGIDYSILNDRIFGKIEGYYRETTDLLNVVPVAAGSNFTNRVLSNVGTLEVQGLELEIAGRIINTQDTYWELGVNVSKNSDEITKLTTIDDPNYIGVETGGISGGVGNTIQIHSVGFPRNSFFVYEQIYNSNGMPIEGLYVDRNGDGVVNDSDKYRYESPSADYEFGFSSRMEYKNWDASFAGHASVGNYVYNNVASGNAFYSEMLYEGYLRNAPASVLETGFVNSQFFSDYYVENASILRLDNVNVGYTFNDAFNVLNSLRISATVQNVFVITDYSGLDPEVFGGIDNNIYPRPRTFVLGLNLNFLLKPFNNQDHV